MIGTDRTSRFFLVFTLSLAAVPFIGAASGSGFEGGFLGGAIVFIFNSWVLVSK